MTSLAPRRLGIDQLPAGGGVGDRGERVGGFAFAVEFPASFRLVTASSRVDPKLETSTFRHWATKNSSSR